MPERVWLTVFEDDKDPQSTMLEWRSPVVRNTQPGDYVATRPHHKIAYVPESLLATVRREEREKAWRPIKTAPQDGRTILVGHASRRLDAVSVRWMISDAKSAPDGAWFIGGYDGPRLRWEPTHWMPIPDAPTLEASVGEKGEMNG